MDTKNIILLISGFINLAMSLYIFSRGWKNKINFYFSLLTFFNFLWAIGLFILNAGFIHELSWFFAGFVYPAGLLVIVNLFYFTVYFPYPLFEVPSVIKWLINIMIAGFTIFCLIFYRVFVKNIILSPQVLVYYEPWSYLLFSIVLLVLMLSSIIILIYKYKKSDMVYRPQILLILIATIIGTAAGVYFNLFFAYVYSGELDSLGPLFTLVINSVVFYLIFLRGKKIKLQIVDK